MLVSPFANLETYRSRPCDRRRAWCTFRFVSLGIELNTPPTHPPPDPPAHRTWREDGENEELDNAN